MLSFEHHVDGSNCRSLMCTYLTHHITIRGRAARIEGSSDAIITPVPSFTSYEWSAGVALLWRDGLGRAAYLYISRGTLAVYVHLMFGNALVCNNSSSGIVERLKRKRYGSTLRLQSIAGMKLVVASRRGS